LAKPCQLTRFFESIATADNEVDKKRNRDKAKKKAPETEFRKPFSVVVTKESHFPESQSRPLGRHSVDSASNFLLPNDR
jgi:hypothetical protein